MRSILLAAAAAALFAVPAQSATFSHSTPGPDDNIPAGFRIDFNAASVLGLSGSYQLVTGSLASHYAQPWDPTPPYSQYLSVPNTGIPGTANGSATLNLVPYNLGAISGFSFYWGSIDTYNRLDITTSSGTTSFAFTGNPTPPPADGNQTSADNNRRVFFTLAPGETLQSLTFASNGIAFEVDDLVFAPVPEPATWAMMIAGFGLVGGSLRAGRRRELQAA